MEGALGTVQKGNAGRRVNEDKSCEIMVGRTERNQTNLVLAIDAEIRFGDG